MVRKAHRWNAVLLGSFLAVHLVSHIFGVLGPDSHSLVLNVVRPLYRNALVEPLLLAAFAVQIGLGSALVWKRATTGIDRGWGMVQIISGIYLALFILAHTSSALFARYANDLDTNFWWPASTLSKIQLGIFFYPYYFLGISALFAHLAAALHFRSAPIDIVRGLAATGTLIAVIVLSGFGGWYREFSVPVEYMKAFETYFPGQKAATIPTSLARRE